MIQNPKTPVGAGADGSGCFREAPVGVCLRSSAFAPKQSLGSKNRRLSAKTFPRRDHLPPRRRMRPLRSGAGPGCCGEPRRGYRRMCRHGQRVPGRRSHRRTAWWQDQATHTQGRPKVGTKRGCSAGQEPLAFQLSWEVGQPAAPTGTGVRSTWPSHPSLITHGARIWWCSADRLLLSFVAGAMLFNWILMTLGAAWWTLCIGKRE